MPRPKKQPKELTYEQRCERAWDRKNDFVDDRLVPPVTPGRELKIGDKVAVGNLEDCFVADLSEDGRYVLIDYTEFNNNYGNPIRSPHAVRVIEWFDCIREGNENNSHLRNDQILQLTYLNSDIYGLLNRVLSHGVIFNPDYQRDYVWSQQNKEDLIESVFLGRAIGSFIFVEYPYEVFKGDSEVLDGKQRLNALTDFYLSRFSYQGYFWHQLSKADQNSFLFRPAQYAHVNADRVSRAQLLQIFLDVNQGGVPQSKEHLEHIQFLLNNTHNLDKTASDWMLENVKK